MLPALFAHRFGRAYGPDSSLTALQGALSNPLEGLETDVCLTADGGLVLLHDPLLEINTTLDGWAHERSLDEICSSRLRDGSGEPTDDSPLALDGLLDIAPDDLTLQLEVKAEADRDLAVRTAAALCERLRLDPARQRVELISYHSDACALAAARGVRSRVIVRADYAPEALASWAVSRGIAGVSIEHFLLTEELVRVMRLAGLSVSSGTVNHAPLLARVAELAPDAVTTDRPHELRAEAEAMVPQPAEVAPALAAA